jgi:hypothetical protein
MTAPIIPASGRPAPATLEQVGILPGSQFLATAEEQAEIEAAEAARIARENAHMDAVLASVWGSGDQAAEDKAADWLDWAEGCRRRRDQRLSGESR